MSEPADLVDELVGVAVRGGVGDERSRPAYAEAQLATQRCPATVSSWCVDALTAPDRAIWRALIAVRTSV